ncbi:hypothetical protein HNY73_009749 [Argiope bruennichi]|uniref:Uncharacterized protein n=1 Tax=Argiope bruennichi TaxID=94029 RepID=A0A8T0FD83_ARGBR|nr:hypothetical protein HNY73_009749 [Argiope bruennichi]
MEYKNTVIPLPVVLLGRLHHNPAVAGPEAMFSVVIWTKTKKGPLSHCLRRPLGWQTESEEGLLAVDTCRVPLYMEKLKKQLETAAENRQN